MSKSQRGFTLIEILMVLVLISVLAAIGVNSFINFRTEARNAALQANLAALRAAIAAQYAQMQLRCGTDPGDFPDRDSLAANNITDGNSTCAASDIDVESERAFLQGGIPVSPWSNPLSAAVTQCAVAAGSCTRGDAVYCGGGGAGTASEGWCYNEATGEIWADSDDTTREGW